MEMILRQIVEVIALSMLLIGFYFLCYGAFSTYFLDYLEFTSGKAVRKKRNKNEKNIVKRWMFWDIRKKVDKKYYTWFLINLISFLIAMPTVVLYAVFFLENLKNVVLLSTGVYLLSTIRAAAASFWLYRGNKVRRRKR